MTAVIIVTPRIAGVVEPGRRRDGVAPDPRPREDGLREHRPGQEAGEGQAGDGDARGSGRSAARGPPTTRRLAQPLGTGRPHVVRASTSRSAARVVRGDESHDEPPRTRAGRTRWRDRRPRTLPIPGGEAVHQQEPGDRAAASVWWLSSRPGPGAHSRR